MQRSLRRLVPMMFVAVSACSGDGANDAAPAPEPSASQPPVVTMTTTSGLHVELRTAPSQPPGRGDSTVEYFITDHTSAPVDGLSLTVVPWMPVMGHGSSIRPTIRAKGGGRYEVEHVVLFMPGQWDLRTTIAEEPSDSMAPSFQVP